MMVTGNKRSTKLCISAHSMKGKKLLASMHSVLNFFSRFGAISKSLQYICRTLSIDDVDTRLRWDAHAAHICNRRQVAAFLALIYNPFAWYNALEEEASDSPVLRKVEPALPTLSLFVHID